MSFRIEHLQFAYDQAPVINDLSVCFERGSFYGIAGPNGSGKSTLVKLMTGITRLPKAPIYLDDHSLDHYSTTALSHQMAFVPQMFTIKFAFTVEDIVMMGRYPYLKRMDSPGPNDYRLLEEALLATDLMHLRKRSINELSGGEVQRVLIARAIVQDTPWILLDEPISHLDIAHQHQIMDLLQKLCQEKGKTIIAVLHDLNITLRYCTHTLLLKAGQKIAFGPTLDVLTPQHIETVYNMQVQRLDVNGGVILHWL